LSFTGNPCLAYVLFIGNIDDSLYRCFAFGAEPFHVLPIEDRRGGG